MDKGYNQFKALLLEYIQDIVVDFKTVKMARGYDKQKAYSLMKQLRLVIEVAQQLDFPSLSSIAREVGVSRQALYDLWEEVEKKNWDNAADHKWQVIIREKTKSGVSKRLANPE